MSASDLSIVSHSQSTYEHYLSVHNMSDTFVKFGTDRIKVKSLSFFCIPISPEFQIRVSKFAEHNNHYLQRKSFS